jgi:hypothetical protein
MIYSASVFGDDAFLQEETERTERLVVTSFVARLTPNRFSSPFSPFAPVLALFHPERI